MANTMTRAQLEARHWKERTLAGYIGKAGPLWTCREPTGWAYGFLAAADHLNPAGVVHGGALTTLIDHAISTVAWEACDRAPCITLQLDTHFLSAVREGQFVEARAAISHRSGKLLFMNGTAVVEGRPVLAAQAILRVLATVTDGRSSG